MSSENSPYKIPALKSFNKEIVLTTSKSHSNRALILGAVRGGGFKVHNISASSDVTNMVNAFKKIGLRLQIQGSTITFENSFPECEKEIKEDVIKLETGDGGTTNRFLIALLARGKKEYHLFPTEKMAERPIEDLMKPLQKLSVYIECDTSGKKDQPWIKLRGPASLYNTTKLEIDCEKSTQFATAMMLAFSTLPLKFEFLNLHASEAYLKMTELVVKKSLEGSSYTVPVDFSSLGYPAALAALMGRVLIKNCTEIDSYQADSVFIELLKSCGAESSLSKAGLEIKKNGNLKTFTFDVSKAPDLFPTLVFLAAHIEGESVFSKLEILKFKESDRLSEMTEVMKSFGVKMNYNPELDLLKIEGSANKTYPHATIRPARDHRIVMASALFMMKNSGGDLYEIDCVEKSFPSFLSLLE
jgi:3-phosphoshikimate 1-carboxyvinyltransferase